MNPDDIFSMVSSFSKYSSAYDTLSSSNYLDNRWDWSCDPYHQSYQGIKNNCIWLNVNYIGNDRIYIERPNCEDLVNIKKLNPIVVVGNDLEDKANYASSFDDIQDDDKGIVINNIEEIEVSTGRFSGNNIQKKLSEDEFNLITTDEKFRNEIMGSILTSISCDFLNHLESQVRHLDLNPNIYHEKFLEIINNLRDYLEITITDSFEDKLAVINPKTYEITKLKPYEPTKAEDYFIEDLSFLVVDEFIKEISALRNNGAPNPAKSINVIIKFLIDSGRSELARKVQSYFNESILEDGKI